MTFKDFENLEIGASFKLGNVELEVVQSGYEFQICRDCYIKNLREELDVDDIEFCIKLQKLGILPECSKEYRNDKKNVVFIG